MWQSDEPLWLGGKCSGRLTVMCLGYGADERSWPALRAAVEPVSDMLFIRNPRWGYNPQRITDSAMPTIRRYDEVVLIGASMGAALALLWLIPACRQARVKVRYFIGVNAVAGFHSLDEGMQGFVNLMRVYETKYGGWLKLLDPVMWLLFALVLDPVVFTPLGKLKKRQWLTPLEDGVPRWHEWRRVWGYRLVSWQARRAQLLFLRHLAPLEAGVVEGTGNTCVVTLGDDLVQDGTEEEVGAHFCEPGDVVKTLLSHGSFVQNPRAWAELLGWRVRRAWGEE